jgi:hypothetical protein
MSSLPIHLIKRLSDLHAELEDYENAFNIYKISFHSREESAKMIPIIKLKIQQALEDLGNWNESQVGIVKAV